MCIVIYYCNIIIIAIINCRFDGECKSSYGAAMHTGRRPSPQVTGISPKEGPPGTRVTIRGEHLGVDARDLTGMLW